MDKFLSKPWTSNFSNTMVLVNLHKLIQLVQASNHCPLKIPNRAHKLFDEYLKFESTSGINVSVKVSAKLENLKELNIDDTTNDKKKQILFEIIEKVTTNKVDIPTNSNKIYLISPLDKCPNCGSDSLVKKRSDRPNTKVIVYMKDRSQPAEVYNKKCLKCNATMYPCYSEYGEHDLIRKYLTHDKIKYFSVTRDTFFDVDLLEMLSEDIFTADCRLNNFVLKYNRTNKDSVELFRSRILHAWLIYSINKRNCVEFPVIRNKNRNLDIEAVCTVLYPDLRRTIDAKWYHHKCKKCEKRCVIMDGAAKVYRTVCAAKPEKVVSTGSLNEFKACSNSPVPNGMYCTSHTDEKVGESEKRLDMRMTRATLKELGLDITQLTTTEGCRKRENITVRSKRNKTAGMLYAYRCCGISLGHLECVHAEVCLMQSFVIKF